MDVSARPSDPKIADAVNAVELFRRAEEIFTGMFELEQLVAASPERALFVARHAVLKRRVALRVHLLPDTPGRTWFQRETELLATVDHAGIRPIYSAGYRGAWAYRVSKWIDGESLRDAVERGPRLIPEVLQMARDLLAALNYAHGEGIVIRRIVPTSVMLDQAGHALITDLRWANRLLDVAGEDADPQCAAFLAPEARDRHPGEPASDVYAAGALLYFAVTGTEPAIDPGKIRPPGELRPACPKALERVILRSLQANPLRRYLTAAEMAADLMSDLGEYDFFEGAAPPAETAYEDPGAWEKLLRRALGDDYELLSELGSGAFGRVYLVRDLALEREVALKVLHPALTADPEVVERFRREAQLAAQLSHPHIVDVYDTGGRAGLLWYTMAYVRGENLAQLVQRVGHLPVARVVRLLQEALSALQHAHGHGLIHRDLKPENMLIESPEGSLQITDFGLAVAFQASGSGSTRSPSRSGTPEFAAPEQLLGEPVDARADLYSLSVVALYALTGRSPFGGGPVEAVLARQEVGRLPDVRQQRPDVPIQLLHVLERGAAREPSDRYASAEAYADALREALRRWHANPLRIVRQIFGSD